MSEPLTPVAHGTVHLGSFLDANDSNNKRCWTACRAIENSGSGRPWDKCVACFASSNVLHRTDCYLQGAQWLCQVLDTSASQASVSLEILADYYSVYRLICVVAAFTIRCDSKFATPSPAVQSMMLGRQLLCTAALKFSQIESRFSGRVILNPSSNYISFPETHVQFDLNSLFIHQKNIDTSLEKIRFLLPVTTSCIGVAGTLCLADQMVSRTALSYFDCTFVCDNAETFQQEQYAKLDITRAKIFSILDNLSRLNLLNNLDYPRTMLVRTALERKRKPWSVVGNIAQWSALQRYSNTRTRVPSADLLLSHGVSSDPGIRSILGFEIDKCSGDLFWLVEKATRSRGALLTVSELYTLLRMDIDSIVVETIPECLNPNTRSVLSNISSSPASINASPLLETIVHTLHTIQTLISGVECTMDSDLKLTPVNTPNMGLDLQASLENFRAATKYAPSHTHTLTLKNEGIPASFNSTRTIHRFSVGNVEFHLSNQSATGEAPSVNHRCADQHSLFNLCAKLSQHYTSLQKDFPELKRLGELLKVLVLRKQLLQLYSQTILEYEEVKRVKQAHKNKLQALASSLVETVNQERRKNDLIYHSALDECCEKLRRVAQYLESQDEIPFLTASQIETPRLRTRTYRAAPQDSLEFYGNRPRRGTFVNSSPNLPVASNNGPRDSLELYRDAPRRRTLSASSIYTITPRTTDPLEYYPAQGTVRRTFSASSIRTMVADQWQFEQRVDNLKSQLGQCFDNFISREAVVQLIFGEPETLVAELCAPIHQTCGAWPDPYDTWFSNVMHDPNAYGLPYGVPPQDVSELFKGTVTSDLVDQVYGPKAHYHSTLIQFLASVLLGRNPKPRQNEEQVIPTLDCNGVDFHCKATLLPIVQYQGTVSHTAKIHRLST
eukprot:NODE_50_length_2760_cov_97.107102_g31_i0.p1 GENE.NODE_50_length_2760_cov_97.107102_g31_i0~~NODE_50_length_2760_cov_97.107102_g31_i0.p1  ORF type:complete len:910 (+),score=65.68 NODE_50_length_2760_cov_97.107102_g31_i0:45-2732(+)